MNDEDNASRISRLIIEFRDILVKIYGVREDQFSELLFVEFKQDYKYDYVIDAIGDTPPKRFFYTIRWFYGDADLDGILALARAVSDAKPKQKGIRSLVEKIRAMMGPGESSAGVPISADEGRPARSSGALPSDLAKSLSDLEQRLTTMIVFVRDLRQSFRANDFRPLDLPDLYHLSDSDGERSAAILALEAYHNPAYSRWLAERVTVESPHAGFLATQALIAAALRASRTNLPRLLKVIKSAKERLDKTSDTEIGYTISARKDNLSAAETLIEMRTTSGDRMEANDLEAYLEELLKIFDRAAFENLFTARLGTSLDFFVSVTGPFELIIVGVILQGRNTELGPKLIRAVFAEKPDNPTFKAIHEKYVQGTGPVATRGR